MPYCGVAQRRPRARVLAHGPPRPQRRRAAPLRGLSHLHLRGRELARALVHPHVHELGRRRVGHERRQATRLGVLAGAAAAARRAAAPAARQRAAREADARAAGDRRWQVGRVHEGPGVMAHDLQGRRLHEAVALLVLLRGRLAGQRALDIGRDRLRLGLDLGDAAELVQVRAADREDLRLRRALQELVDDDAAALVREALDACEEAGLEAAREARQDDVGLEAVAVLQVDGCPRRRGDRLARELALHDLDALLLEDALRLLLDLL
mmetsp:Transcript_16794/g.23136  ORF Transcript_16794/g.23136 Transcript_16794/m.23136 type:complete len:266 (-) Transcript_16794:602-1399(-)